MANILKKLSEMNDWISEYYETSFKTLGDSRGSLIALEQFADLPFELKRVFFIYGTQDGVSRGFHAHKVLKQVLVAVSGSCVVDVEKNGKRESIKLDRPDKAIYVAGLVWHEMHSFSPDCVLISCASELYDESDYIRSYDDFKAYDKRFHTGS